MKRGRALHPARLSPMWSGIASAPFTHRLFATFLVALVLGYAAVVGGGAGTEPGQHSSGLGAQGIVADDWLGPDQEQTDLPTAERIMADHRCPGLPSTGPASRGHVTKAWKDPEGQVALEFDNRLQFTYAPETRSPATYVDHVRETMLTGDFGEPVPGMTLVDLRGTSGDAFELSASGPATVAWVEGSCLIELYGDGGQSLAEMTSIANSMPPWEPPPPPCRPWDCPAARNPKP